MARIGERLRGLLKESGLQQKEAAGLLGMKVTTFSGYVNNYREADIDVLITIADFFGVSLDYLTGRIDERTTSVYGFIKENIDLIKGNMSYSQMSEDIGLKLNNRAYAEIFTSDCLEELASGVTIPSSKHMQYLSMYAGVKKDFFYRKNTDEDLTAAREEYKLTEQIKRIDHLEDDLNRFVRDPENTDYIAAAEVLKENGIDLEVLAEMTVSQDEFLKLARIYRRIKNKGLDPDGISGFTLKSVKI